MAAPGLWTKILKRRQHHKGRRIIAAYRRAAVPKSSKLEDASTASPASPGSSSVPSDSPRLKPHTDPCAVCPPVAVGDLASAPEATISKEEPQVSCVKQEAADFESAASSGVRPSQRLRQKTQEAQVLLQTTGKTQATDSQEELEARRVVLLPSVFKGRPPVVFFTYTEACTAPQREVSRAVYEDVGGPKLHYCHTKKVNQFNAVINTMRQGGLHRATEESNVWALFWSKHPPPETLRLMTPTQRANHFPGSQHLGNKDLLWSSISEMQQRFGSDYVITPVGYVLPEASASFNVARQQQPDALWIWKPCSGSCGRGIKVFSSQMTPAEQHKMLRRPGIVQRYVPSPLTVNGYKFDLRIYVVVLSYEPLQVYINDEGLARLATHIYSEDPSTLADRTMHLTNYSVNKKSPLFVQNKDGRNVSSEQESPRQGGDMSSKWSLAELRVYFAKRGLDYELMFDGIKDVVIKTLLAVEPRMREEWAKALDDEGAGWFARGAGGAHSSSCFEIYGFDILVDTNLKPWLLEVNICPSLSSGSPLDKRIKTKLVADALTLKGIRPQPGWKDNRGVKRRHAGDAGDGATAKRETSPSAATLAERAERLAACESPQEAVGLFDQAAWELVMEAHDQDMRRGSLERIYPTCQSAKYVPFVKGESFANVVLRRWYEAGGAEHFWVSTAKSPRLPAWVPRPTCFTET